MEYINKIKKLETSRPTGKTPNIKLDVKNKRYAKLIDELENYRKKVDTKSRILGKKRDIKIKEKENETSNILLDNMRLTVLAKHFESQEKNKQSELSPKWLYNQMLSNMGFRSYCGANTNILKLVEEDKDLTQPYKIDEICRVHDYDYTLVETEEDIRNADAKMLKSIAEQYLVGEYPESGYGSIANFLKHHVLQKTIPNIIKLVLGAQFIYNLPKTAIKTGGGIHGLYDTEETMAENDMTNKYVRNIFEHELEKYGKQTQKGLVNTIWTIAGTSLIIDTMFAATASFAIGIKMLIEPVVGQITNTITEEYSFDPFDIEKDVKEFLKIQNKIATDAGVEVEPFKSSILDIKIEEVKETKKEEEIVEIDYGFLDDIDKNDSIDYSILDEMSNEVKKEEERPDEIDYSALEL